jgi:hypothetical protein
MSSKKCSITLILQLFLNSQRTMQGPNRTTLIIFISYLAFRLLHHRIETRESFIQIDETVAKLYSSVQSCISCKSEVTCLPPEGFYSKFRQDVANANNYVAITHLDTRPPEHLESTAEETYYKTLSNLIISKPNVLFQRVERVSIEKRKWLEELVENYSSTKNFSLYCLISEDTSPHLSSISVQLIDKEKVYLVAVSRHTSPHGGPRDIYIRDNDAYDMWHSYYENELINRASAVIVKGRLDRKKWEEVKLSMEGS